MVFLIVKVGSDFGIVEKGIVWYDGGIVDFIFKVLVVDFVGVLYVDGVVGL